MQEAEAILAKLTEEERQARVFGVRPKRTFDEAAAEYLRRKKHKRSILTDASRLKSLMPYLRDKPIDKINQGTLATWIEKRKAEGATAGTINHGLKVVRQILNCAVEWNDDAHELTWLATAPKFKLLPDDEKRESYPLEWEEQDLLFSELPGYLRDMALFAVNTGCREQEICQLRWQWEKSVPELSVSVFEIPRGYVKNKKPRLVVLNHIARGIVEKRRQQKDQGDEFVFAFHGQAIARMNNHAWRSARLDAALWSVIQRRSAHCVGFAETRDEGARSYTVSALGEEGQLLRSFTAKASDLPKRKPGSRMQNADMWIALRVRATTALIDAMFPFASPFARVRVHDLKHTFGKRLRYYGVAKSDRTDLLGHTSGKTVTDLYTLPDIKRLFQAANRVC